MSTTIRVPRTAPSNHPATGLSRRAALRVVAGGLAGAVAVRGFRPAIAAPAYAPARAEAALEQALVGTWVIEFVPAPAAEAATKRLLTTFAADGAVRESLAPEWATEGRRHGGVGQGLWTPIADGSLIYRSLTLRYDEDGWYLGEEILRASFALDSTKGTLTGEFGRRYLDADGAPMASEAGAMFGVRADDSRSDVAPLAPADLPPQPGQPGEPY